MALGDVLTWDGADVTRSVTTHITPEPAGCLGEVWGRKNKMITVQSKKSRPIDWCYHGTGA